MPWLKPLTLRQTYWNLDGFQNPDTSLVLNHTLSLPYSGQRVGCDGNLIPTGDILANQPYSVNDFRTAPKQIGANFSSPEIVGNCGTGCTGYDTCYLVNREAGGDYDWHERGPVAALSSDFSGIKIDIFSDQDAFQVYSCGGMDGSMPLKNTQGFFNDTAHPRVVEQYGCVVLEVEDVSADAAAVAFPWQTANCWRSSGLTASTSRSGVVPLNKSLVLEMRRTCCRRNTNSL